MSKGKLVVISGPSGVGKGTIVKRLLDIDKDITVSISATTRNMRPGEVDGKDYIFMTKDKFEKEIANNSFVEYAQYSGNYYGTLISTVKNILNEGKILILEIDVQGAFQIKEKFSDAKLIFIAPPSVEELKKRLIGRNTEAIEVIEKRMAQVDREISSSNKFDSIVINDDLEVATSEIYNLIKK